MKVSASSLFAFDIVWTVLFCAVAGPPLVGATWLFGQASTVMPWWLNVGLIPAYAVLFLLGMTGMVALIRLPAPRLVPGTYAFPHHRIARSWMLHFALQRILYLPLWRPVFFSIAFLRTAALRSLGGTVPMAMSSASDPQLLDPSLLTIGRHSIIGASVMTTCHFIVADKLRLAPIHIGDGVQLHEAVKLGPGVSIGDHAVIGLENRIGPGSSIGAGAQLAPWCKLLSAATIGDGAQLGAFVTCERGVTIGAGATIAAHSHIPAGTTVEPGALYPPPPPTGDGASSDIEN